MGVNILRSTKVRSATRPEGHPSLPTNTDETPPVFEMHLKKWGIVEHAQELDGEFVVLAGSRARSGWLGVDHGYGRLKNDLEEKGTIIAIDQATAESKEDQVFSSPSAAAAMIAGRSANGRIEWKIRGSGLTYGEWQERKIDTSVANEAQ